MVVCGEQVKVMVLEMKMASGFLFFSRLQRSLSHTLNKCSSGVLLVYVFPLWLRMMKQFNEVEAWKSSDEGVVEVELISGVVSSRFCALV